MNLTADKKERVLLIRKAIEELKDLKWRYEEGPSGRGRANLGFTNSTGCSSVWGSSYPYNPYPFPWVNHLFQDAPSVAVGIFEGHMRKMADGFMSVRRAEKLLQTATMPSRREDSSPISSGNSSRMTNSNCVRRCSQSVVTAP